MGLVPIPTKVQKCTVQLVAITPLFVYIADYSIHWACEWRSWIHQVHMEPFTHMGFWIRVNIVLRLPSFSTAFSFCVTHVEEQTSNGPGKAKCEKMLKDQTPEVFLVYKYSIDLETGNIQGEGH